MAPLIVMFGYVLSTDLPARRNERPTQPHADVVSDEVADATGRPDA